jgi:hypothetical protein
MSQAVMNIKIGHTPCAPCVHLYSDLQVLSAFVYISLHLGLTLFRVFWKQRRLLFLSLFFADFRDMTMSSSSSSYANTLCGPQGPRAPVQALPLHHAPLFQENTIFVNLREAAVDYTQKERDSFLKDDLGLRNEDVLDIFLDPSTLHLLLTPATPALFTAVGNFLVYGWASVELLVTVP